VGGTAVIAEGAAEEVDRRRRFLHYMFGCLGV